MNFDLITIYLTPFIILVNIFWFSKIEKEVLSGIILFLGLLYLLFALSTISLELMVFLFMIAEIAIAFKSYRNIIEFLEFIKEYKIYLIISIIYLSITFTLYSGQEIGHTIAISMWPSIDNNISYIISKKMCVDGSSLWSKTIFGEIPLTDRVTPALSFLVSVYCLTKSENFIFALALCLQLIWIFPVNYILNQAKAPKYAIWVIASSPLVFFNSIYIWWKILAAAIILIGMIQIRRKIFKIYLLPIAFLVHASSIYSFAYFYKYLQSKIKISWGSIAFIVMVATFICLNIKHPGTGQLLRWHLFDDIASSGNIYNSFINAYDINLTQILVNKLKNIKSSIYAIDIVNNVIKTRDFHSGLELRYLQQYSLYFNFIVYLPLISFIKNTIDKDLIKMITYSFVTVCLIEFGGENSLAILHHRSFAEFFCLILLCAIHLKSNKYCYVAIAINVLNLIFIWQPLRNVDGIKLEIQYKYIFLPLMLLATYHLIAKKKINDPY